MEMLPEMCFALNAVTNEVVVVKRWQVGYYPTREGNLPWYGKETVDAMNEKLGVTKAQAEAMFIGSMFGWDAPGADPDWYDEDGKTKEK